jgi:hypothetical protein
MARKEKYQQIDNKKEGSFLKLAIWHAGNDFKN